MIDKDVQTGSMAAFKGYMTGLGYMEDENVFYTEKSATGENANKVGQYAQELNEAGLDIIVTGATSATVPLKKLENLKTPVYVISLGTTEGLISVLHTPEGFITGTVDGSLSFTGKRLEFLKEINPSMKKVISIVDSKHSNAPAFKKNAEEAAGKLGLQMVYIEIGDFSNSAELLSKIPMVTRKLGDAYINCACPSGIRNRKELVVQLNKEKIPSISGDLRPAADIGFLAAYSDDPKKLAEFAAKKVDKILKGTPISSIPVTFATDVLFELNLNTAKMIGVTIPQDILARANKTYNE